MAKKKFLDDKLHEECGVFGIFGSPDASTLTTLGLHALQHRGQEGAGIVTFDGDKFNGVRRPGLVGDNFNKPEIISRLPGRNAIGHVRYSTTCLLYTSPSPRDATLSRMPSSA